MHQENCKMRKKEESDDLRNSPLFGSSQDDISFVRHDIPSTQMACFPFILFDAASHRLDGMFCAQHCFWHRLMMIFPLFHYPSHRNDGMFLFPAWLVTGAAELWLMIDFLLDRRWILFVLLLRVIGRVHRGSREQSVTSIQSN